MDAVSIPHCHSGTSMLPHQDQRQRSDLHCFLIAQPAMQPGSEQVPNVHSSWFSTPETQELFPLFYFAFKGDRNVTNHQSLDTSIQQWDKSPLWLMEKTWKWGGDILFLWGWLWIETPETVDFKSFSPYSQITLQVNTFLVHWAAGTSLKKNPHWKVIMVEKYSLLYHSNSCATCLQQCVSSTEESGQPDPATRRAIC